MKKRPKSREEKPKEGSDSARGYRTAKKCDPAAQKARVFDTYPVQSSAGLPICNSPAGAALYLLNQSLTEKPKTYPAVWRVWYAKTRNLVIVRVYRKFTIPTR